MSIAISIATKDESQGVPYHRLRALNHCRFERLHEFKGAGPVTVTGPGVNSLDLLATWRAAG